MQDIEVEQLSFKLYPTDSLLIYPLSINVWRNYLIIMEPKLKDSIYSIWDRDDFAHLFSCGRKGNGPNELINPRRDYYASTDSSFFILDSDIEREVCFEDKTLVIKRNNDINLPDAINQLVRLGDDYYILAGLTNGSTGEHIIYKNGGYSSFGEFPRKSENEERRFFTNYKLTAGDIAHDCICDFYLYQNLIRIYDIKGNLLKHIQVIDNACVPSTSVELRPVFHELKFNSKYIAVLYNNKYSTEEIYSDEKFIQELQLWNWKGELKKRICFDFPFDIYAISEDDILYAVNSGRPDYIYTYDLK